MMRWDSSGVPPTVSRDAVRVAVFDSHPLVIDALRGAIERSADLVLAHSALDLSEARTALAQPLDVVVSDIRLGQHSAFDLLIEAGRREPRAAFLVLTSCDSPDVMNAAHWLGAAGYLMKTSTATDVLDAVRRVAAGDTASDPSPVKAGAWRPLTGRERDVLAALIDGRSNIEIAAHLRISPRTVEVYLGRLYARSRVQSRTALAVLAERNRWLDVPSRRA